jgi:alpha-L-fucosidase
VVYERLAEIGKWMEVNGEAIYNTKWLAPYQSGDFCFTRSNDGKTKYAIYLKAEDSELPDKIQLPAEFVGESAEIQLLGCEGKLQILTKDGICSINIPNSIKNAFVVRLIIINKLLISQSFTIEINYK